MFIIRIVGRADLEPTLHEGKYIQDVDFNGLYGRGVFSVTRERQKAMKFQTMILALEYWKTISPNYPVRPDGKPNRPLTAFTITIDPY